MSRGLGKNQRALLRELAGAGTPMFLPKLRWAVSTRLGWRSLSRSRRETLRKGVARLQSEHFVECQERPYESLREAAELHPFYADTPSERTLKTEVLDIILKDVMAAPEAPMQWTDLEGEEHWLRKHQSPEQEAKLAAVWAPIESRLRRDLGRGDTDAQDWRMALLARGRTIVESPSMFRTRNPLHLAANASIDELLHLAPPGEHTEDLLAFGDLVRPPQTRAHMRWKAQLSNYVFFGDRGGKLKEDAAFHSFSTEMARRRFERLVERHRPERKDNGSIYSWEVRQLPAAVKDAVDRRILRHDHLFVAVTGLGARALQDADAPET